MKHLRLTGENTPASLGSPTPLSILSTLRRVRWGWKVVDRGRGVIPFFSAPVAPIVDEMNAIIDERFGIATCPTCLEKVAVLVDGICRDCGPEVA